MSNSFLVTVVVPVYNAENYLNTTIVSVLDQSIGFEENIEIILVNNASTDLSGKICACYAEKYPYNIKVVHLEENQGPCGARNVGLEMASGRYINFLDSDDVWESDAYEELIYAMENLEEKCNLVVGRVRHFDGRDAWHGLDWKFHEKDKAVVDIFNSPMYVQLHLGSALIKTAVAKKYRHDQLVYHAEDAKYMNQIILDDGCYGLCKDAVYLYRYRKGGDSVLQNVSRSTSWYNDTLERVYFYWISESIAKYDRVIEYVQYLVMYELQWRLAEKYISEDVDGAYYVKRIQDLLQYIDDNVIMDQKTLWKERKLYALELKHGNYFDRIYELFPVTDALFLKSVLVWNNKIHINGFLRFPYTYEYEKLFVQINGESLKEILFDKYNQFEDVFSMGKDIAHADTFFCVIPYSSEINLKFVLKKNVQKINMCIRTFKNTKISNECVTISKEEIVVK